VIVGPGSQVRLGAVWLRPVRQAALVAASAARLRHHLPDRGQFASVSGIVRSRSGKRMAGICVWVYPKANYFAGTGVTTSRSGSYDVGYLPPGRDLVQFTAGCPNRGNYAPQYWKYAASPGRAAVLHLRAGEHARGIDGRLGSGGKLSGTVRAAGTGTPLAGVCVSVTSVKPSDLYQLSAITAADGSYSLDAMATGRYQMQFQPDCGNTGNYLPAVPHAAVQVTAGKATTGVDASLPPGAEISGVVTGSGGTPLAGICVYDNSNFAVATTGADGSYAITRLGAGRNTLAFEGGCGNSGSYAPLYYPGQANPAAAVPVTVAAGQVRSGIDASMSAGGEVTGTVTSAAGRPLTGICVTLLTPSALEPNYQNLFIPFDPEIPYSANARTHAGSYRIANLAPGLYYAEYSPCAGAKYPPLWFKDQGAFGRASLISVAAGTVTAGVDATLPRSGTISGTITDRTHHGAGRVCVTASNVAGQDWLTIRQAVSHHGTYRITGLAPGRYAVLFAGCSLDGPVAAQWYRAAAGEPAARAVLVRPGHATAGVDAMVGPGGSISGQVVDAATGGPVNSCAVIAVDPDGTFMGGALVGKDGRYRIRHLLAGRYTLQACGFGLVQKAGVVVRGTRPTRDVTITLPDTGALAGQALDSQGTSPEAGVCVTAYPIAGPGVVTVAATGRRGRWTMTGLDPGTYRVQFSPVCMAGFPQVAPQWFNDRAGPGSATPVRVAADKTTTGIDAMLPAPGSISGTVTDLANADVPGICVAALPEAHGMTAVSGVTATDGTFTISDLAPGKYLVRFEPGCGATGYLTQWFNSAPDKSGATPVTITAGVTTADINATLRR
jgi:hypothetical protein